MPPPLFLGANLLLIPIIPLPTIFPLALTPLSPLNPLFLPLIPILLENPLEHLLLALPPFWLFKIPLEFPHQLTMQFVGTAIKSKGQYLQKSIQFQSVQQLYLLTGTRNEWIYGYWFDIQFDIDTYFSTPLHKLLTPWYLNTNISILPQFNYISIELAILQYNFTCLWEYWVRGHIYNAFLSTHTYCHLCWWVAWPQCVLQCCHCLFSARIIIIYFGFTQITRN